MSKTKNNNNKSPNGVEKMPKHLADEFTNLTSSKHIPNYYEFIKKSDSDLIIEPENPNIKLHGIKIPSRGLIIAPSGTGKTNFLLHMLNCFNHGKGTFSSIQVICSSKAEPIYEFIEKRCPNVKITEGIDTIPKLSTENFDKKENHMIILDDLVLEKNQERICKYYMACRKFNVTIFYLSQKYFTVPIFIRQNATLLFLFHIGDSKKILSSMNLGLDIDTMMDVYKYAIKENMTPLRINITEKNIQKKFFKGLIEPIYIEESDDETDSEK